MSLTNSKECEIVGANIAEYNRAPTNRNAVIGIFHWGFQNRHEHFHPERKKNIFFFISPQEFPKAKRKYTYIYT